MKGIVYLCLMKPFVIGICGGSGSGKTTLLRRIAEDIKHLNPSVFTMDNYYHPIEKQSKDAKDIVNFDLPTALNEERLTADLISLIQGNPIEVKEYFFNSPPDKNVLLTIHPSQVIIVEGLFLFHYQEVKNQIDFSIFVDVDHEVQLDRRIYRDQETRGYKRSDIIYQWENHVLPCYEQYISPYKSLASYTFANDHRSEDDFQKVRALIREKIPFI
jgi:uridine kinase